jgi:transposase
MLTLDQVEQVRRMDMEGLSRSRIARELGVSRPTVRKYLGDADFSPRVPEPSGRATNMDGHREWVDALLEADKKVWSKQRHTAKRVFERLVAERGYAGSYSSARRYVKRWREQDRLTHSGGGFNDLVWEPGSAQADFGEADFDGPGGRVRRPYLVVSFPYSNQGFAQVFGGETAECVCQGLGDVFAHVGGVPPVVVFDNAAGIGRRVVDEVRETELFRRFRLHHRFEARFCNPYSGHEKGNVENKVGTLRRNWFVPVPRLGDVVLFNEALLAGAGDPEAVHYEKDRPVVELFAADQAALLGLPARAFQAVSYREYTCDKYGKVEVGGVHTYSVAPEAARQRVVASFGAHRVQFFSLDGKVLASHPRLFGKGRALSVDHVAMMTALVRKPGAWRNSELREQMGEGPGRAFLDSLDRSGLRDHLKAVHAQARVHGLAQVEAALDELARRDRPFTAADLAVVAARVDGFGLGREPDAGPDLGVYDRMLGAAGPAGAA